MSEHLLVSIAREKFNNLQVNSVHLVDDIESNNFLNDIVTYPHAYVLACCMDRQVKAERAWMIPCKIKNIIGGFSIKQLAEVSLVEYKNNFVENSMHRYNEVMAEIFYKAIHKIADDYDGNASKIWHGNPSSATVVYRFLQFEGVGIKIATMAANILARQFKIPFSDYYSIDVSPDVHVKRVMTRIGLVPEKSPNEFIIYKAREMCPEFPGIIDYSLWEIGRTWCSKNGKPRCKECLVKTVCKTALKK